MVEYDLMQIIQMVSWLATAIGVCVAATYYVMTLRINQRALRINMTNNLLQFSTSVEGQRVWMELMNMKWSSYDDFEKKYGSDNNIDNFAKRQSTWNLYNTIGKELKAGLLDRDTIYHVSSGNVTWTWAKFRSVLEENRKRYTGKTAWDGFEYLANEMMRMSLERNPEYKIPENFAEYVPDK